MMTYNLIVHINSELAGAGLYYKLRYKDDTSASIEPLGHCCCEGTEKDFTDFILKAFLKEGIKVTVEMEKYAVYVSNEI